MGFVLFAGNGQLTESTEDIVKNAMRLFAISK